MQPISLSIDGKIYSIPRTMSLLTLVAPRKYLKDYKNWTVDSFFTFLTDYPDAFTKPNYSITETKSVITDILLRGTIDQLIDNHSLNTKLLQSYLERINDVNISEKKESVSERMQNDEVIIVQTDEVSTPDLLSKYKSKMGTDIMILGYPSDENTDIAASLLYYEELIGITKYTNAQDGALQFVKEYILSKPSLKYSMSIPTCSEYFEEALLNGTDRERIILDGVLYEPVSESEIQEVREAYQNAKVLGGLRYEIINIILEECIDYYEGIKGLDSVIDVIESRANIILWE